ncbi:MAG: XRE family transcriptional regulator [Carnobacterium sp.]|uniref:LexA family protein n=1 Tax=Carnobacterium sp. TaxID=48221 RepID=UPI003C72CF83
MLGQRLKDLRTNKKKTQDEVASYLGITRGAYSHFENERNEPSQDLINKIADYFEVSIDYLYGRTNIKNLTLTSLDKSDMVYIPIVGTIRCGSGGIAYTEYEGTQAYSKSNLDMSHDYVVLKTKGDSMSGDGIADGDLALIQKEADFVQNKIYAVAINGDEATLKRVNKMDGAIMLTPSNPDYPPTFITGEELNEVTIIGRLINIQRNF